MFEFSVLMRPAEDLPGQWVAHCLNWDVISHGASPTEAASMIAEALAMVIEDDRENGLDPSERKSSPQEYWDLYSRIRSNGRALSQEQLDAAVKASPNFVIASTLYMVPVSLQEPVPMAAESPFVPPPAFMIEALEGAGHRARA